MSVCHNNLHVYIAIASVEYRLQKSFPGWHRFFTMYCKQSYFPIKLVSNYVLIDLYGKSYKVVLILIIIFDCDCLSL